MARKSVHVTYRKDDGKWHITNGSSSSSNSNGSYQTQKEAMQKARKMAMESSSEFCVHGKDGKIRLSTSYGNDPRKSKRSRSSSSSSSRRSKKSK